MKSPNSLDANKIEEIKNAILGESYELSFVFLDSRGIRRLNRIYRGKDASTNILSFPLSKNSGEILLCPKAAGPWSLPYLFIHGCLHLKGHTHGATMEDIEQKLLKRFTLYAKNSHGHRRRHLPS